MDKAAGDLNPNDPDWAEKIEQVANTVRNVLTPMGLRPSQVEQGILQWQYEHVANR
jgi:hypothetical protein